MKPLTPQQLAAAAAKRAASIAARKASGGLTVRQQRAAAKAAKAGQTFVPPPPAAPKAPRAPRASRSFGRRRRPFASPIATPPPAGPVFSTPKPTLRALRLAALVALEDVFKQKCIEQPATVTQDVRDAFTQYKKVMTRATAPSPNQQLQNEADTALRVATLSLVKLGF